LARLREHRRCDIHPGHGIPAREQSTRAQARAAREIERAMAKRPRFNRIIDARLASERGNGVE